MTDFCPVPEVKKHGDFLQKVVDLMFKNVVFTTRQDNVLLWQTPEELERQFDFTLKQNGEEHDKLMILLKDTIKFSVKTGHPYFINQLFSGLDPYGLAGQWLTDSLNASVYTYEVAPVFSLMESHVIREVCRMVGPQWGDGLFCPGGSFANGMAANLARHHRYPEVKLKGTCHLPKLVILTSEECHYSVYKFAAFIGLGEENVCKVHTDSIGSIIPSELEHNIEKLKDEGSVPIMVVATLGTTVRGAFDPITDIADICRSHSLWLHVDAAWGGGLLFSQKHRAKLNGLERADSIVVNPHKLLAVPQQCSLLLLKNQTILRECHSRGAEYLFQKDKHYDAQYDLGDKYLQCGRKCDVFKFWFMWKAKMRATEIHEQQKSSSIIDLTAIFIQVVEILVPSQTVYKFFAETIEELFHHPISTLSIIKATDRKQGSSGFANHIDALMDVAVYFEEQVNSRPEFMLVSERQYMNVCFWYLPRYLRGRTNILEYAAQLHKVAPQIRAVMIKHGSVMLGYQPLKGLPNFFRFVSQNSALTKPDIDLILDHIAGIGDAIFQ